MSKPKEKSAEVDRSAGTRKQKKRRQGVGKGGEIGGQQGGNGRGQDNRPRPHVSMMETRN